MTAASPADLAAIWRETDALFARQIGAHNAHTRPIHLRHPFIFYLGHLPAFSWNLVRRAAPHLPAVNPVYERRFERGIDPDIDASAVPDLAYPPWRVLLDYQRDVRRSIARHALHISPVVLRIVAEHEAMHIETLKYMLAQSSPQLVPATTVSRIPSHLSPPTVQWVSFPAAAAVASGTARPPVMSAATFGWDNEFDEVEYPVAPFSMARHPVSCADYLAFVLDNGYRREQFWQPDDWKWIVRDKISHPQSWRYQHNDDDDGDDDDDTVLQFRILTGDHAVIRVHSTHAVQGEAADWPVSVSLAEARAYAKWAGARLCTEHEWVHAVSFCEKDRSQPTCQPTSVHVDSDNGPVCQLQTNGWELTTSVFETFAGFVPTQGYEGYSADFFDGKHFVLRGASWVTLPICRRPSFRNFFQARYPFVFSKFRLVRDD